MPCAIVGRPNAGKSSLLNALVGFERAIVTDIPGTTRDTVEERCVLGGVLLRLIDTAGLRETGDAVEKLGVERSRAAMEAAGLIFVVIDGTEPATGEDEALVAQALSLAPTIVLRSKADLPGGEGTPVGGAETMTVSAVTGEGLKELGEKISALFSAPAEEAGEMLTNARQAEAAGRALQSVERAGEALSAGVTPDALLTDVEQAMEALGELTGRHIREDVTDRIFERFCVGK